MAGRLRTVPAPPFYSSYASNDTALRSVSLIPYKLHPNPFTDSQETQILHAGSPAIFPSIPTRTILSKRASMSNDSQQRKVQPLLGQCVSCPTLHGLCCALAHVALSNLSICFSHTIELGLGNLREGSEG